MEYWDLSCCCGPPSGPQPWNFLACAAVRFLHSEVQKSDMDLLAMGVLIGGVLAAAVVCWIVIETDAPSRHRTASGLSMPQTFHRPGWTVDQKPLAGGWRHAHRAAVCVGPPR
jgi:hypothetical protein